MSAASTLRALAAPCLAAALACAVTGCASAPKRAPAPHPAAPASLPAAPPASVQAVPDAVPRVEPRSPYGNPPFYEVFGHRYYVLPSSADYVERGVASWYGPGFHKVSTSTHEIYDMYGMTAAHKTLPLPCYVRVTNLQNGRSVVVRVNDRGPFVGNRIIDLSYTAAAKLDMLREGTAMVEIRTIDPRHAPAYPAAPAPAPVAPIPAVAPIPTVAPIPAATPIPPAPAPAPATSTALSASITSAAAAAAAAIVPSAQAAPAAAPPPAPPAPPAPAAQTPAAQPVPSAPAAATVPAPAHSPGAAPTGESRLYVQAGAFLDPANAERLAAKLRGGGYGNAFVQDGLVGGRRMYRVRIGPVPDVPNFDRIVEALEHAGVHDAHLALD